MEKIWHLHLVLVDRSLRIKQSFLVVYHLEMVNEVVDPCILIAHFLKSLFRHARSNMRLIPWFNHSIEHDLLLRVETSIHTTSEIIKSIERALP